MLRVLILQIACVASFALTRESAAQQITARLSSDFSSSSNPNVTGNGTYEYRTASGTALLSQTGS